VAIAGNIGCPRWWRWTWTWTPQFHNIWIVVAANTPDPLPDLESLFATAEWQRLRAAALLALQVFLARGKLTEDREHGP
jgi:hypothetical protein